MHKCMARLDFWANNKKNRRRAAKSDEVVVSGSNRCRCREDLNLANNNLKTLSGHEGNPHLNCPEALC